MHRLARVDEPPLAEPLCVTVCEACRLVHQERRLDAGADAGPAAGATERGVLAPVSRRRLDAVVEALVRVAR